MIPRPSKKKGEWKVLERKGRNKEPTAFRNDEDKNWTKEEKFYGAKPRPQKGEKKKNTSPACRTKPLGIGVEFDGERRRQQVVKGGCHRQDAFLK